jgi:alkanesulfonate monooxygenase SsuD/methylene tetrahydromethanopterin reductase-like flavin-dependent oxidoreductase (luciferase family)
MRHGLYLPNQGEFADVRRLAEVSSVAEANGWDGVFLWDALLSTPFFAPAAPNADPFIALTAMALATERVRIGALVSPVARLRPEVVASQTATIDRLSDGRLVVGVGLGDPAEQFGAFGLETDLRTRAAIVDEFVELVVRLWSGQRVDFSGQYFTARNVQLTPPLQQPRIPVWVGGAAGRNGPLRRAARWDGYVPLSTKWPDGAMSVDDFWFSASALRTARASDDAFDVVVLADRLGHHPDDDELAAIESLGVTWHLVQPFSIEDATKQAHNGPGTLTGVQGDL